MIITVDEAIPYWEEAFSGLGEVRPFSGRLLNKEAIRDADALIVRTITRVDASILEGSAVRFVAAASAGIDHVDLTYLRSRGIGFGYAPGSNADSVSEYIATALCVFASRRNWRLKDKSVAVIGVGNVGSRVVGIARALGMEVLLCDPPVRDLTHDPEYKNFNDILGADFLSFHVPLVKDGPYPTFHMLDGKILDGLSPGRVCINASRGAVFNNKDLRAALHRKKIEGAILDVWEDEPRIDYSLLNLVDIGTPHIAGSSLDGKIRATEMVCKALHDFYGIPSPWSGDSLYPNPVPIRPGKRLAGQDALLSVLLQAYNILDDDRNLRRLAGSAPLSEAGKGFDRLRSGYRFRPEFRHFTVVLNEQCVQLSVLFEALGFQVRQIAET
ncbi:MAG: 4-phosphoerythronate dehydrogenase [Acidobacteria bacterium]|nr:4-phosphoerythronate dehydrogenase [Acidobacteriota bacterium]